MKHVLKGIALIMPLLVVNAYANPADEAKGKALFTAVQNRDVDLVKKLIKEGAPVNYKDPKNESWSPLQWAAYKGYMSIAEALIGAGADKEQRNDAGYTPLYAAEKGNNTPIVSYLMTLGANARTASEAGNTPLMEAARKAQVEIARLLIGPGAIFPAIVDAKNKAGETALSIAQKGGTQDHKVMVALLKAEQDRMAGVIRARAQGN